MYVCIYLYMYIYITILQCNLENKPGSNDKIIIKTRLILFFNNILHPSTTFSK